MPNDLRRDQKRNRKQHRTQIKNAQRDSGVKPKRPNLRMRSASTSVKGTSFEKVCKLFKGVVYEKDAKAVFDWTGDPSQETLILVHKLLRTYAFAIVAGERLLRQVAGTAAEEGVINHLEQVRINARCVKDLCNAMVKVRGQYFDEDHDTAPDAITLRGADIFRSQLTTVVTPAEKGLH